MTVDKANIKFGFWIAVGFFLFTFILSAIQYAFLRTRKGNG